MIEPPRIIVMPKLLTGSLTSRMALVISLMLFNMLSAWGQTYITMVISGPSPACANNSTLYTYTASNYSLTENLAWSVTGGTPFDYPAPNQVRVKWSSTSGQIYAYGYAQENCHEVPVYYPDFIPQTVWYYETVCTDVYYSSNPLNVTAYTPPSPPSFTTGPTTVCTGATGNVYTTQSGKTNYIWTVSAGGIPTAGGSSTDNFVTVTWNTGGSQSVMVSYTPSSNPGGCPIASTTLPVTVGGNTPVQYILSGGGSYCLGGTGVSVSLNNSQTGVSYQLKVVEEGQLESNSGGAINGTNGTSLTWTNRTVAGSYYVVATHTASGCTQNMSGNVVVSVVVASFTAGPTSVCLGATGVVYSAPSGMSGYSWNISPGGSITAGLGTESVTVSWPNEGIHSISVNYATGGCTPSTPTARNVTVTTAPTPISSVTGLRVSFAGDNARYVVQGSDALIFVWQVTGATPSDNGGGLLGKDVQLTYNSETSGTVPISVTPQKNSCNGTPFNFNVDVLPLNAKKDTLGYINADLTAHTTGYLYLANRLDPGQCTQTFGPVEVRSKFDLGETYNWGSNPFSKQVDVQITAHYEYPGVEQSWTTSLVINQLSPEKVYTKKITATPDLLRFIQVKVLDYTTTSTSVNNYIRLVSKKTEDNQVNVTSANLTLNPVSGNPGEYERTFSWTSSCTNVPNYQFQLMRTYANVTPTANDWANATNLETSGATSVRLSIVEGSATVTIPGQYYWRVRPIGNKPDGIINPDNLPPDGPNQGWKQGNFTFTQPEEDRNWIYSRTLTEGLKQSEKITYANTLQQVAQQQTRLQSNNSQIVASQTLQDFVGRNAIASLPIPIIGKTTLGYQPNLLQDENTSSLPFTKEKYDLEPEAPPNAVVQGGYYSGADVPSVTPVNAGVGSTQGFPYTRTLFTPDGTGRVREQSGVGEKHSLKHQNADKKTVRTYYVSVSEAELVMLMGKEAPEAGNVQKIVTRDANNVASVTYQNKDGRVLATALTLNSDAGPLDALSTQPASPKTLSERIVGGTKIGPYEASVSKPLFFLQEPVPDVKVNYSITPTMLTEICSNICKTCDYKVEFFLHKEGDPAFVHSALNSASITIPGGNCPQNQVTIPEVSISGLEARVMYTLEKRITVYNTNPNSATGKKYLEEHIEAVRAARSAAIETVIAPIRTLLQNNDIAGLNTYLNATYSKDTNNQYYIVPIGSANCLEYLNIPVVESCLEDTPDPTTRKLNNRDWEQYFLDKTGSDITNKIWFSNKDTGTKQNFALTEFNTMVGNLLDDNGVNINTQTTNGLITLADVWDVWKEEVRNYIKYTQTPGSFPQGYVPDILSSFLTQVQAKLDEKRPAVTEPYASQLCQQSAPGNYYYFIKKGVAPNESSSCTLLQDQNLIYGKIGGTVLSANKLYAYRLIYFDEDKNTTDPSKLRMGDILLNLAGYSNRDVPPSCSMFKTLDVCTRYRLYQSTQNSDFTENSDQAILEAKDRMVRSCQTACESRREEFVQAIIASIMSQNSAAVIEHYRTYQDGVTYSPAKWVSNYDLSYNPASPTYTECQIIAMTNALIQNCQSNYCQLTFLFDVNGKVSGVGTTTELDNLNKVFSNRLSVQVNTTGQTCQSGWTSITLPTGGGPTWSGVKGLLAKAPASDLITLYYHTTIPQFRKDLDGNLITIGKLQPGTVYFNQGTSYTNPGEGGPDHYFFAKYSPAGNLSWTKRHFLEMTGGGGYVSAFSKDGIKNQSRTNTGPQMNAVPLTSTSFGFALQVYYNQEHDVKISPHVTIYTKAVNYKAYAGKYDGNGNLIWIDAVASADDQENFSTEKGGFTYIYRHSNYPIAVEKRDATGAIVWTSDLIGEITPPGNPYTDSFYSDWIYKSMVVDNAGNVYLSFSSSIGLRINGSYLDTVTPGTSKSYLVKFNSSGLYQWFKAFNADFLLEGQDDGVMIAPMQGGGNLGPSFSFSVPPTDGVVFKVNAAGNVSWLSSFPYQRLYPIDFQEDAQNRYFLYRNQFTSPTSNYFVASISKTSGTTVKFTIPNLMSNEDQIRHMFKTTNGFDFIYEVKTSTVPPGLPLFDQNKIGNHKYQYFFSSYNPYACSAPSLCFKFETQELQPVVIPPTAIPFNPTLIPCVVSNGDAIRSSIEDQINNLLNKAEDSFTSSYFSKCPDPSFINDNFVVSYSLALHHFTLYYYDRAGNLIRTVPPEGMKYADLKDVSTLAELDNSRLSVPTQSVDTKYEYNSLGQLTKQTTPDAGATKFWYNDIGLLRFSQNAQQYINQKYSYTKYDNLGRVIEVGEKGGFVEADLVNNRNNLSYPSGGVEVTRTIYSTDLPTSGVGFTLASPQRYLRNRVSYSFTDEDGLDATLNDRNTTVYSYDPHGNVEWLVQRIAALDRTFQIGYEYELVSGSVLKVSYNAGQIDQYFHKYEYDDDKRIKTVSTSRDGQIWDKDASYDYYLHGPLRRVTIGEDQVQGLDYTYTAQGWLKGINNPLNLNDSLTVNYLNDPGKDGGTGKVSGIDAFGMTLQYFTGDFVHTSHPLTSGIVAEVPLASKDLFNGNIAAWTSNMRFPSTTMSMPLRQGTGQKYTYDQLNRLKIAETWQKPVGQYTVTTDYKSTYLYDGNGNITYATNTRDGGTIIDNLTYAYSKTAQDRLISNKLRHILDTETSPSFTQDVDNQATDNYSYDANGNLISDAQQSTAIAWNPYGKVKQVVKTGSPNTATQFKYDAAGNRVSKRWDNGAGVASTDYYVRDASGNVMAVYNKLEQAGIAEEVFRTEVPIYGSDRLGEYMKQVPVIGPAGPDGIPLMSGEARIAINTTKNAYENKSYLLSSGAMLTLSSGFSFTATSGTFTVRVSPNQTGLPPDVYARDFGVSGQKDYELKDHLGNVRVVVTDLKKSSLSVANVPENFRSTIISLTNYYPFGMEQPGRAWSYGKYRFGFNGKEKDQNGEWGAASTYDYGFRIYNPSIGKFLSVDPLTKSYPMLTPYQFASNRPIQGIDLDGLEFYASNFYDINLIPKFSMVNAREVEAQIKLSLIVAMQQSFKNAIQYEMGSPVKSISGEVINAISEVVEPFDKFDIDRSGLSKSSRTYKFIKVIDKGLKYYDIAGEFVDAYDRGVELGNAANHQIVINTLNRDLRRAKWVIEVISKAVENKVIIVDDLEYLKELVNFSLDGTVPTYKSGGVDLPFTDEKKALKLKSDFKKIEDFVNSDKPVVIDRKVGNGKQSNVVKDKKLKTKPN